MEILSVDMRPVAARQLFNKKVLLKMGSDRRSGRELPLKLTATHNYS
jgi:hypothetical protein